MTRTFDPTLVTVAPQDKLGEIRQEYGGDFYQHVEADSAISAGRVVAIEDDYGANHITHARNAAGKLVGVAKTAIPSGQYGWVSVKGKGQIQVAASCAAHTELRTTTVAGQLDDATGGSTEAVDRIVLTAAAGAQAGLANAVWNWPSG